LPAVVDCALTARLICAISGGGIKKFGLRPAVIQPGVQPAGDIAAGVKPSVSNRRNILFLRVAGQGAPNEGFLTSVAYYSPCAEQAPMHFAARNRRIRTNASAEQLSLSSVTMSPVIINQNANAIRN
jgi:hypothetical protein